MIISWHGNIIIASGAEAVKTRQNKKPRATGSWKKLLFDDPFAWEIVVVAMGRVCDGAQTATGEQKGKGEQTISSFCSLGSLFGAVDHRAE